MTSEKIRNHFIFNILLTLSRANIADQEVVKTLEILKNLNQDQKYKLIKLAKENQTLILFNHNWKTYFSEVDLPLSEIEINFINSIELSNSMRTDKTYELIKHFENKNIPLILLKGTLFSHLIYNNNKYKKMNDLDLLLNKEFQEIGINSLKELNYQCIGDIFKGFDIGGESHHTPPYISSDLKCITGLHWGITSKHSPFKINEKEIFKRMVEIEINNTKVFRMSWEDNIIHLCVHLPFYKLGIRELADVSNLIITKEKDIDWILLNQIITHNKIEDPVYRVLTLSKALISFNLPVGFLEKLESKTSCFTKKDTSLRKNNLNLLLHSRSVHIARIEKYFVIFKLSTKYTEQIEALLKMYQYWFFPNITDMKKIIGVLKVKTPLHYFYYRLITPIRIWNAMERDHGFIPLVIVTALNFMTALKSTLFYPFRKDGTSLKNHKYYKLLKALE